MLMQENTMKPTFGSLFAGVGGFDMGMEDAGWECKFQVEWDKHCQHILNKHWPDIPKWGDVSTVSGTEIPPVDCIIFGSPCQDLSVAGKRAGLQGERSGLFYEAVRIIKEMRHATNGTFPRWAIWENVAGALSSNNGRDFAAVISEMAEAGAVLQEYALLDAQYFGIPQRRRRVFLVACFDPAIARNCPDPLLPVSESLRGNTAKGKSKGQATADSTTAGFGSSSFGGWSETDTAITLSARDHKSSNTIVGSLAARDYKGVGSQYVDEGKVIVEPFVKSRRAQSASDDETWVEGQVNPTLNSFDMGDTRATTAIVFDDDRRVGPRIFDETVGTLQAFMGTGGNNTPMVAQESVLFENSYRDGARIAKDGVTQTLSAKMGTGGGNTPMVAIGIQGTVIGRQDENGPAGKGHTEEGDPMFTLTSTDIHAVAQSMAVRRLTPLECERLMGWPDDHTRWKADGTEQADTHRYKQCGNGVASPVAKWIASHILKAHQ
jgi:DNA (cytosine-5)-methyltransferase 1